jgi:hypothetical protein
LTTAIGPVAARGVFRADHHRDAKGYCNPERFAVGLDGAGPIASMEPAVVKPARLACGRYGLTGPEQWFHL